jgi:predicted P-loop ATPase
MTMENTIPFPDWKARLQMGDRGPKKNLTNLIHHLRGIPKLGRNLRFNELAHRVEWNGRPVEDSDLIDIRLVIEAEGYQPNDKDIRPAVERVARETPYNPITAYLDGLKWDGEARLSRWLIRLMGAPETPFVRSIGPKVLISAVARAYEPGCKVDTILVIEGPQGLRKSSGIAALFGSDYTAESVSLFDQHNKMVMAMMGSWVVELAEFVAIVNSRSAGVKGLISMRSDRVVLPYAKMASTHPRRCIFVASINPDDATGYLTDSTGNRRYWPVTATKIDLAGIARHRDQLWAEAVHLYREGERWWLEGDEENAAMVEQEDREEDDAWTEPLRQRLTEKAWPSEITVDQALTWLSIANDRKDKRAQMRAASAIKALGYERSKPERPPGGGKPRRLWRRP